MPADQAERGRINQIHVARDQFLNGCLGTVYRVLCEQVSAVRHCLFISKAPPQAETEQKIWYEFRTGETSSPRVSER